MVNYTIGDFLIQIKNAGRAGNRTVVVKYSKFTKDVADVLKREGYLEAVDVTDGLLTVTLKFHKKAPILMDIKLVSKPGLRIYTDVNDIEKRRGASMLIISTSQGILSSGEAKKKRVGGETIAEIW